MAIVSQYIEDIQIFAMNMPFISSSEATDEIYIFSLHEMKQMTYSLKNGIFFLLYTILNVTNVTCMMFVCLICYLLSFC